MDDEPVKNPVDAPRAEAVQSRCVGTYQVVETLVGDAICPMKKTKGKQAVVRNVKRMAKRADYLLAKTGVTESKGEHHKLENKTPTKAGDQEFVRYTKKFNRFLVQSQKHSVLAG